MPNNLQIKLEVLQEYLDDKIYEILPAWTLRLGDNIKMTYRAITSSFVNWKDGYGFFPDSDLWNLDATISKFALPRLRKFISLDLGGVPMDFGIGETEENQKLWKEALTKMQVAFMEEEEWFKWKYPNIDKPLYGTHTESVKYMTEYYKEYKEGCQLLGKHFGNLWW